MKTETLMKVSKEFADIQLRPDLFSRIFIYDNFFQDFHRNNAIKIDRFLETKKQIIEVRI